MANKFITLLTSDLNKVEQYCQRTIAIYDCDIQTTQFNLTETDKYELKESGRKAVNGFFDEYFKKESFKEIHYNNRSELEKDIFVKNELIKLLSSLRDKHTHERELSRLKLEYELSKEKLLKLDKKTSPKFFKSGIEASTSKTQQAVSLGSQLTDIMQEAEEIEKIPSYVEASFSRNLGKATLPLKADDENDGKQKSSVRKLCCF